MRTYGLSGSGMDVDQMVKDLMKARRVQYDTIYKKKTQLEWKKADYNTVYNSLTQFRTTVFNSKLQSSLATRKVSSNNSAITATASAGAAKINHTIEVGKLAGGVQQASNSAITTGSSKDTLVSQFNVQPDAFTLKLTNGSSTANITVDPNASIYELVENINKAGINVSASYDATIDRFFLATTSTGANTGLDFSGNDALGLDFLQNKLKLGTNSAVTPTGLSSSTAITANKNAILADEFTGLSGTFKLNIKNTSLSSETNIDVDLTHDTLNSIAQKISNAAGIEAVASYDSTTRSFTIKAKNAGEVLDLSANTGLAAKLLTTDLKLSNDVSNLNNVNETGATSTANVFNTLDNIELYKVFEGLSGTFDLKLTNGLTSQTISIDTANDTIDTLKTKIQGAAGINATVSFDSSTRKLTIGATSGSLSFTGSSTEGLDFLTQNLRLTNINAITPKNSTTSSSAMFVEQGDKEIFSQFSDMSGGKFVIKVKNGAGPLEEIPVDTSVNTLEDILATLNAKFGAGTAEYALGKVTLKAPLNGTLDFSGSDPAALDFFVNKLNLNMVSQKGQDAELKLDGANITQASNVFTVSGVTYTLNSTTEAGKPASLVVTPDIDKTITAVKSFVDEYNKILSTLNTEANEAKYKNYLPLTDEEKNSLSDDQVKAWEEKAKSGLLQRDSILSNLVIKMRNSLVDNIAGLTGDYKNASSIGISTLLGDRTEGGKLYVDETKLRTALEADPDIVYKLFSTDGSSSTQDGVLIRLADQLKAATDQIVSKAGISATALYDTKSALGKQVNDLDDQMERMTSRLNDMENRYYKQFDAMETALNRISQQGSWLAQQFSSN